MVAAPPTFFWDAARSAACTARATVAPLNACAASTGCTTTIACIRPSARCIRHAAAISPGVSARASSGIPLVRV